MSKEDQVATIAYIRGVGEGLRRGMAISRIENLQDLDVLNGYVPTDPDIHLTWFGAFLELNQLLQEYEGE